MRIVPVIRCSQLARSIVFYTRTLDFELADPSDAGPVIEVIHGDAELQLSSIDGVFGCAINVWVTDIDARFQRYLARGLDPTLKAESPVHQGPLDQSWGTREFYVTDPDGNTLRFRQRIEAPRN